MTAYLGTIGELTPVVQIRGQQDLTAEREFSEKKLLSGVVRVQVAPRANRKWSCSVPYAEIPDYALLKSRVLGELGGPPLFVPVDGPTTNVMSPQRSLPGRGGGWAGDGVLQPGVQVLGVGAVTGLRSAGGLITLGGFSTPVMPGRPVTGSVWVGVEGWGTVKFTVSVFTASGAQVASSTVRRTVGTTLTRVMATVDVPNGGAYVQLRVTGANSVACAACTWTPTARPWAPGVTAPAVFISGWSSGLKMLHSSDAEPIESVSFDVMEVGDA